MFENKESERARDDQFFHVFQELNKLTSVDLRSSSSEDCNVILEALPFNETIRSVNIDSRRLSFNGAQLVADIIRFNSTIVQMGLGYNAFTFKSIKLLSKDISRNTTLETLDFSGNSLGSQGAILLGSAIAQSDSLECLALSHCRLADDALPGVLAIINNCKNLKVLDISNNWFSDKSLFVIKDALAGRKSIRCNLSGNKVRVYSLPSQKIKVSVSAPVDEKPAQEKSLNSITDYSFSIINYCLQFLANQASAYVERDDLPSLYLPIVRSISDIFYDNMNAFALNDGVEKISEDSVPVTSSKPTF